MLRHSIMGCICAALAGFAVSPVFAQTCAAPYPLAVFAVHNGSSCGENRLPALNHGATWLPGGDVVFRLTAPKPFLYTAVLNAQGSWGAAVFVCRSCGVDSECINAAAAAGSGDAGVATVPFEVNDGGDYYVIVDSTTADCGSFSLSLMGPLDDGTQPGAGK